MLVRGDYHTSNPRFTLTLLILIKMAYSFQNQKQRDKATFTYQDRKFRPTTLLFFVLVAAYVVVPYFEIPYIGLSLSAPLMYLVALEVFFRPPEPWLQKYAKWIGLAVTIWLAIFVSLVFNNLLRNGIDLSNFIGVFHYGYWILLVFPVTVYLVSRANLFTRVFRIMTYMVVVLALLRWYEGVVLGKYGAWTGTQFFTQNSYGILFSTFSPFLLTHLVDVRSKRRGLIILALLLVFGAVAINGSRGSWVALAVGVSLFTIFYIVAYPKPAKSFVWIVSFVIGVSFLINVAPQNIKEPFFERYETLQHLEKEKTFVSRKLMVGRGLTLFKRSPVIGVGPGQWYKENVVLSIPEILPQNQEKYNNKSAHNSYIMFLAEMGLLGAVPYVILMFLLVTGGYKATLALTRQGKFWALGIYTGFLSMNIHLYALSGLTGTNIWLMYGLVAGMIVRYHRSRQFSGE